MVLVKFGEPNVESNPAVFQFIKETAGPGLYVVMKPADIEGRLLGRDSEIRTSVRPNEIIEIKEVRDDGVIAVWPARLGEDNTKEQLTVLMTWQRLNDNVLMVQKQ